MSDENSLRKQYVKEKQLHHLFELLAAKVLAHRPENVYQYLREQLTSIEEGEAKHHKYDPSQVRYGNHTAANPNPAARNPTGSPAKAADQVPSTVGEDDLQKQLKVNLSIFGLNNAGKTALVSAMGGNVDTKTTPTVGFSPVHFETDEFQLCIFDLGGAKNFRGIWQHYYADCHGYIYVVDASDTARLAESVEAFKDMIAHKYVRGKPVLIFANKKDVPGSASVARISQLLDVKSIPGETKVIACCAIDEADLSGVEEGIEWMLQRVRNAYPHLQAVIDSHTAEVKVEKQRKLEEQRLRVEAERRRREEGGK